MACSTELCDPRPSKAISHCCAHVLCSTVQGCQAELERCPAFFALPRPHSGVARYGLSEWIGSDTVRGVSLTQINLHRLELLARDLKCLYLKKASLPSSPISQVVRNLYVRSLYVCARCASIGTGFMLHSRHGSHRSWHRGYGMWHEESHRAQR